MDSMPDRIEVKLQTFTHQPIANSVVFRYIVAGLQAGSPTIGTSNVKLIQRCLGYGSKHKNAAKNDDMKHSKKKKTSPPTPSKLTPTSGIEEDSRHVNLDLDLSNTIITGTDYGVATLATTVARTVEQLQSIKD
ncbi:hypothetical protein DFQ29_006409, partial [Apophysomyces sp. BC1021]